MSNPKKKFKDSTVGKLLFGAASIVSPQLGAVLNGVTSPKDAIAEITKSKIPNEDKIKFIKVIDSKHYRLSFIEKTNKEPEQMQFNFEGQ